MASDCPLPGSSVGVVAEEQSREALWVDFLGMAALSLILGVDLTLRARKVMSLRCLAWRDLWKIAEEPEEAREEIKKQRLKRSMMFCQYGGALKAARNLLLFTRKAVAAWKGQPNEEGFAPHIAFLGILGILRGSRQRQVSVYMNMLWGLLLSFYTWSVPALASGGIQLFMAWQTLTASPLQSLAINGVVILARTAAPGPEAMEHEVRVVVFLGVVGFALLQHDKEVAKHILAEKAADVHSGVRAILNARTDALLQLDADLCIEDPTWQLEAVLGTSKVNLSGQHFSAFLPFSEDKKRFEVLCTNTEAPEDTGEASALAGALKISIKPTSGATFQARVFHVTIPNRDGPAKHLLGICRDRQQPEVLEVPPAQLAAAATIRTRRSSSSSRPRSEASASAISDSTAGQGTGSSKIRCTVDAFTKLLEIDHATDEFEEYCDLAESDDLVTWMGPEADKFASWMTKRVNEVLHDWSPVYFCYMRYGSVKVRSLKSNIVYRSRLFVTFPDPAIANNSDTKSYKVTVSLELKEMLRDAVLHSVQEPLSEVNDAP